MLGHRAAVLLPRLVRSNAYTSTTSRFAPLVILNSAHRTFATPGRPKSAVGETSRPVKRAVKKAAKSTSETAATKKVAAKKKAAAKKPKNKELTEKQQARKDAQEARERAKKAKLSVKSKAVAKKAQLVDLKAAALEPPKVKKSNPYTLFLADTTSGMGGKGQTSSELRSALAASSRNVAAEWKNLSPAQIEHYNHEARTAAEDSQSEYKRWVESHTPAEIRAANVARVALRRHEAQSAADRKVRLPNARTPKRKWRPIRDERAVKKPVTAFLLFSVDRQASGDLNNIHIADRAKLVAQEWKSLDASEKQKYESLYAQDKARYIEEYTSVYGVAPRSGGSSKASTPEV